MACADARRRLLGHPRRRRLVQGSGSLGRRLPAIARAVRLTSQAAKAGEMSRLVQAHLPSTGKPCVGKVSDFRWDGVLPAPSPANESDAGHGGDKRRRDRGPSPRHGPVWRGMRRRMRPPPVRHGLVWRRRATASAKALNRCLGAAAASATAARCGQRDRASARSAASTAPPRQLSRPPPETNEPSPSPGRHPGLSPPDLRRSDPPSHRLTHGCPRRGRHSRTDSRRRSPGPCCEPAPGRAPIPQRPAVALHRGQPS
jgi:hypothetical protein